MLRRVAGTGLSGALIALAGQPAQAMSAASGTLSRAASVVAVRVWPAKDYTRVAIELDEAPRHSHQMLADPPRLVVDLEGVTLDRTLRELVAKIRGDDPYIEQVRVGQFKPNVLRLVFDLKTAVDPQVFTLPPIDAYRHRVVIDMMPAATADPLLALLREPDATQASAQATAPSAQNEAARGKAEPATRAAPSAAGEGDLKVAASPAPAAAPAKPPARPTRLGKAARPKPGSRRLITIAIDPGHGGEDPGAIGASGTHEKDVVLAIAQRLRERINRETGMRAFLTRDGDYFVPLGARVHKARRIQADLFVSIHADAFVKPHARGASVFVLSDRGASSTTARWLANRENRSDLIGGVSIAQGNRELARMLLDLSTSAQIRDSSNFGRMVLAELGGLGRLHRRDIEQAGFAVLKAPDIPSILVETAFISNPEEEARLTQPRHQREIAEAIYRGIRRYFIKHPATAKGGAV